MASLITGGAGSLGVEVVRILLEEDEKNVTVFDLSRPTSLLNEAAGRVAFVQGDLRNFSHVLNAVKVADPSVIYHLGGMLAAPAENDPSGALQANVMGTAHVLEAARLLDVPMLIFASSIATYVRDLSEEVVSDDTLQHSQLFYNITKLFCENTGLFFRRKYDLDFRSVRLPWFVGLGVKVPSVLGFTSRVIEECARGNPYTIKVPRGTKIPLIYIKDAARAMVMLRKGLTVRIKTVNYALAGFNPAPSVRDLTDIIINKLPGAQIQFKPEMALQQTIEKLFLPVDDSYARNEWNWQPEYNLERMVDDFLAELERKP